MPRQLPWLNKGGASRTQVKQAPKPRAGAQALSDLDDDFLDGTILAGSGKDNGDGGDSGDDLPNLPMESSSPRTIRKTGNALRKRRAPSSSPPPIQDYVQPQIEYMRAGASKFDLRDDEWMMVEDEFLDTAKSFTRHLHIAEYEKLKERIEAKKREQVQAARPVVAGGKMSAEGAMRRKAKLLATRQKEAIQDVFASQDDEDGEKPAARSLPTARKTAPPKPARATATTLDRPSKYVTANDTDSDDLDASRPTFKRPPVPKPKSTSASSSGTPTGQEAALPAERTPRVPASPSSKNALAPARQRTARKSRALPFDMLDDYKPHEYPPTINDKRETPSMTPARTSATAMHGRASETPVRSSSSTKVRPLSVATKAIDPGNDWGADRGGVEKTTAEMNAKRKSAREKAMEGNKKVAQFDDIPTFLL